MNFNEINYWQNGFAILLIIALYTAISFIQTPTAPRGDSVYYLTLTSDYDNVPLPYCIA